MNRPLVFQQKPRILRGYYFFWSRCADSNRGPAHYECAALPLSHIGIKLWILTT